MADHENENDEDVWDSWEDMAESGVRKMKPTLIIYAYIIVHVSLYTGF